MATTQSHAKTVCYAHDPSDKSARLIYSTLKKIENDAGGVFLVRDGKCLSTDYILYISFVAAVKGRAAGRACTATATRCPIEIYSKVDIEYKRDDNGLLAKELRQVFLHEFGHCMGLRHSKDPTSIMNYTVEPAIQGHEKSYLEYINQLVDTVGASKPPAQP
jgi:predicted Zn-dependent protease